MNCVLRFRPCFNLSLTIIFICNAMHRMLITNNNNADKDCNNDYRQ